MQSVMRCERIGCWESAQNGGRYCSHHNPFPWVYGRAQFYPLWQRHLLFWTGFPFMLGMRVLWQSFPIWPVCLLFWLFMFVDEPLRWRELGGRRRFFYGVALLGAASNAVVTLANGGVMPVAGKVAQSSLWVPLTDATRLPFLADIYRGASVGDFIIIAAIIGLVLNWLLEKVSVIEKEKAAIGKRLPGIGI